IVDGHTMSHQMFLAQVFSVICTDNHQCMVKHTSITQPLEECPYEFILVGNFCIVHTVQNMLAFLFEIVREGSQPSENIAIELTQLATSCTAGMYFWCKT